MAGDLQRWEVMGPLLFKTVTSAVTDSVSELRVRIFGTNKDQASVELDSVSHDIGCLYSV